MASVAWVASFTRIAFLWHNVVGAVVVVLVGLLISLVDRPTRGLYQSVVKWISERGARRARRDD
jgi:hypothetical protein